MIILSGYKSYFRFIASSTSKVYTQISYVDLGSLQEYNIYVRLGIMKAPYKTIRSFILSFIIHK